MASSSPKFDLAKAVMAGMTIDDLLDFSSAFVPNQADTQRPTEVIPPYKPSLQLIADSQEATKAKITKPQVTVNIPIEHYKRQHFCCELCGQPPKLMCSACKETYYWYALTQT
jgi:hypothetical protein